MADPSRAKQVLQRVVQGLSQVEPPVEMLDAWTEDDDVFCLVYRQPEFFDGTLGLRRRVESDWTIAGVAGYVLEGELGEPLGTLMDTLRPDDHGVMWWTGDKDDWKGPPQ